MGKKGSNPPPPAGVIKPPPPPGPSGHKFLPDTPLHDMPRLVKEQAARIKKLEEENETLKALYGAEYPDIETAATTGEPIDLKQAIIDNAVARCMEALGLIRNIGLLRMIDMLALHKEKNREETKCCCNCTGEDCSDKHYNHEHSKFRCSDWEENNEHKNR